MDTTEIESTITSPSGINYADYASAYRDSLQEQYDAGVTALDQERTNDFASINSNANTLGMLYSNFPERSKIQYDTNTYYPSLSTLQSTYQTGLDSLRENTVSLANSITSIQDAIAELEGSS